VHAQVRARMKLRQYVRALERPPCRNQVASRLRCLGVASSSATNAESVAFIRTGGRRVRHAMYAATTRSQERHATAYGAGAKALPGAK
jgi:hypothetical protein